MANDNTVILDELGKYVVVEDIAEGTFGHVKSTIPSISCFGLTVDLQWLSIP